MGIKNLAKEIDEMKGKKFEVSRDQIMEVLKCLGDLMNQSYQAYNMMTVYAERRRKARIRRWVN